MIELSGPAAFQQASTSAGNHVRGGARAESLEATIVDASDRADWWAVRVEIVKSRPPPAASVRAERVIDAVAEPVSGVYAAQPAPRTLPPSAALNVSQPAGQASFEAPNMRRAVAAYGAQRADVAATPSSASRLDVRA